jgi:hypothetical protein
VYYWDFNETESPYAEKAGKLPAATGSFTTSAEGVYGNAVNFPAGQTATVNMGTFELPENNGTISMWIKPDSIPSGSHYHLFAKANSRSGPSGWVLYLTILDTGVLRVGAGLAGDTYADSQAGAIQFSQWQHVAVAWSPQGITFYVNGQSVPISASRGTTVRCVQGTGIRVALGTWGSDVDSAHVYRGPVDELKIFGRTLTGDEVKGLAEESNP